MIQVLLLNVLKLEVNSIKISRRPCKYAQELGGVGKDFLGNLATEHLLTLMTSLLGLLFF